MLKASFIICFLLAVTAYCKIPPSPDFNITNFVGGWNVVGLFSTTDLGLTFYSCATLNVTLGTLSRLTLTLSYINGEQYQLVQNSVTLVPSPLDKAILISTTSPSPQNNYVVTYYDSDNGEAILINSAATNGYILSRNENPFYNNFEAVANNILNNISIPLSNVTYIFNKACDVGSLKPLTTFDPTVLAGVYYGNAIFTSVPVLQGVECFTSKFESLGNHLLNVTTNFTFSSGKIIYTGSTYIPLPELTSVLANTQVKNLAPFVIIYADASSQTYVAVTGDSTKAFVFSQQPTLSSDLLAQAQQALVQNGLIVTSSNFYTLNQTCSISEFDSIIM